MKSAPKAQCSAESSVGEGRGTFLGPGWEASAYLHCGVGAQRAHEVGEGV